MHKGIAVAVGMAFGALLAVACGNKPPCATSCNGCCDAMEVCQLGSSVQQCGRGGFNCQSCALGQVCVGGFCSTLSGAGGGSGTGGGSSKGGGTGTGGGFSTGGGTGTGGGSSTGGGGGSSSCPIFPTFNVVRTEGTTLPGLVTLGLEYSALAAPYDLFGLETIDQNGGAVPGTQDLSQHLGTKACAYCVVYGVQCGGDGGCAKEFIGTAGTVTVTQVVGTRDAGSISAIFNSVVLTEWNPQTDLPASPSACFNVPNQSFFVSWGGP